MAQKTDSEEKAASFVTMPVRIAAAWSWRVLAIAAVVLAAAYALSYVSLLVVAFLIALLFAALLSPLVSFLDERLRIGRTAAASVGLLLGLVLLAALITAAITQVVRQFPLLLTEAAAGLDALLEWVAEGPWGTDSEILQAWTLDLQGSINTLLYQYGSTIALGALRFATGTFQAVTGSLLMLFTLFFMLRDGRTMWIVTVRSMPKRWREKAYEAGIRAWVTLGEYVRTQSKVAAIDALGIGLGAMALGVPLAVPIMVLVFLLAFIPVLGAFISGGVAILIALVNNGVKVAVLMFLIVLAVQQLESNLLHPWMMAHAVALHPVVVVFGVTAGFLVGGVAGAIFSVPLLAVLNVVFLYLHGHDPYPALAQKEDRPGGAPGSLEQQIWNSYPEHIRRPSGGTRVARKVRAKAQARAQLKGHVLAPLDESALPSTFPGNTQPEGNLQAQDGEDPRGDAEEG